MLWSSFILREISLRAASPSFHCKDDHSPHERKRTWIISAPKMILGIRPRTRSISWNIRMKSTDLVELCKCQFKIKSIYMENVDKLQEDFMSLLPVLAMLLSWWSQHFGLDWNMSSSMVPRGWTHVFSSSSLRVKCVILTTDYLEISNVPRGYILNSLVILWISPLTGQEFFHWNISGTFAWVSMKFDVKNTFKDEWSQLSSPDSHQHLCGILHFSK